MNWENPSPDSPEMYAASTRNLTYVVYPKHFDAEYPYILEVRDSAGLVVAIIDTEEISADEIIQQISYLWNTIHLANSPLISTLDQVIDDLKLQPPF